MGYCPMEIVSKTLTATTQMVPRVEAETREIMRDHLLTRLPALKHRRINDSCYTDTFFASIESVRGYTCWQLFAFRRSCYDVVYLQKRRSQCHLSLMDLFRQTGVPSKLVSDNAKEFHSAKWTNILRKYCVDSAYTEPHHPNENLAERRGGTLKNATWYLLHSTEINK